MNNLIDKHIFWKKAIGKKQLFSKPLDELYNKVDYIHKITYVFCLFLIFIDLIHGFGVVPNNVTTLLWPVFFLSNFEPENVVLCLQIGVLGTFVLLCFNYKSYAFRVANFLLLFFLLSYVYSFGKISHGYHLVLLILFCFLFIPKQSVNNFKIKSIIVFATAQYFLLVAFSLTGFWKVVYGLKQLLNDEVSIFSPLSFRNILIRQFEITESTVLGNFLIEHYILGWVLYLFVIYIEMFSVCVFFRPNLHKVWGVMLIIMAAGIKLILGVNFFTMPFIVGILLVLSPFNNHAGLKDTFLDFPLIYCFRKYILKK